MGVLLDQPSRFHDDSINTKSKNHSRFSVRHFSLRQKIYKKHRIKKIFSSPRKLTEIPPPKTMHSTKNNFVHRSQLGIPSFKATLEQIH